VRKKLEIGNKIMASVNFNKVQRTDLSRGLKQEASSLKIIL